jgi:tetratricopeptide (TPR) repeat protein
MSHRRKHLEFLKKTAVSAARGGDFRRALELWEDGLGLARAWKDREYEDLFACNQATTLIEMSRFDFDLTSIKSIILRNPSSANGALATYVCALTHEARGEYERAASYARSSLHRARELAHSDLTAGSLNLLADLELKEGHFVEALPLFEESLARLRSSGEPEGTLAGIALDNIGYCHIALDRVELGAGFVSRALEVLEASGARHETDYPCLDLCFASLKREDPEEAGRWGAKALSLGEEFRREDVVKNAHYLLAEACAELGQDEEAERHYDALARYYPDFPALKNYLRQISLVEMINLRA